MIYAGLHQNEIKYHELKCLTRYYQAIERGDKTFEVRYNDRNYQVGDRLRLMEFVPPDTYTGRVMILDIIYMLDDPDYCKDGFVILEIRKR